MFKGFFNYCFFENLFIDRYVHSEWNHTAPQARLMFFNETMDPRCGLEVVDISEAKETEPSELFELFFPDMRSEVEEEDERARARIDSGVRRFASLIRNS